MFAYVRNLSELHLLYWAAGAAQQESDQQRKAEYNDPDWDCIHCLQNS